MHSILAAPKPVDPCNPSPCGLNAICNNGQCTCMPDYLGNPLLGCRPECILNTDCGSERTCLNRKCVDPCEGMCGVRAHCKVVNHVAMCYCSEGMTGNPFERCTIAKKLLATTPCQPNPCGPNSQCRVKDTAAICSCLIGYMGNPPNCRLECYTSSDCLPSRACVNNRCIDPCPGQCGSNADCQVIQHRAQCECRAGYNGNPYRSCARIGITLSNIILC